MTTTTEITLTDSDRKRLKAVRGKECYPCRGYGEIWDETNRRIDCPSCHGTGRQLTEVTAVLEKQPRLKRTFASISSDGQWAYFTRGDNQKRFLLPIPVGRHVLKEWWAKNPRTGQVVLFRKVIDDEKWLWKERGFCFPPATMPESLADQCDTLVVPNAGKVERGDYMLMSDPPQPAPWHQIALCYLERTKK